MSTGFCECGCGGVTKISPHTDPRHGVIRGEPNRFIKGHHLRKKDVPLCGYVVDCDTGCWVWMLARDRAGYGRTKKTGRHRAAHIVAWESVNGEVAAGMEIDHICRNVSCVNPSHLEQVTPTENKRRSRATKINKSAAAEIKAMNSSPKELAEKFGVTVSNISHIRRGKSWKEIEANK